MNAIVQPPPACLLRWVRSLPAARIGVVFGLAAAAIWGGYITVSGLGIRTGLSPADMAFLRYGTAGAILLPFLLRRAPATLGGIGWRRGFVLSLLAGPLYVLVGASGYRFAPLAHGAVIQLGVLTMASMALAAWWFGERMTLRRAGGLAVLLLGLATVAGPGLFESGSDAWRGDLLFATAGLMFAGYTALVRRWRLDAFAVTVAVAVFSALLYAPFYFATGGAGRLAQAATTDLFVQALVQGVLSGIVALYAFSKTVEYLGPARAALFPAIAPAMAMLLGIPVLAEWPTLWQWTGLVVATVGLLAAMGGPSGHRAGACRLRFW